MKIHILVLSIQYIGNSGRFLIISVIYIQSQIRMDATQPTDSLRRFKKQLLEYDRGGR